MTAAQEPVKLMTMRVTRIRDGQVIEQGPLVEIESDGEFDPYALSSPWPPCRCPRHRGRE